MRFADRHHHRMDSTPTIFATLAVLADPLLRIAVGAFLIPHGWAKVQGMFGVDLGPEHNVFAQCGLKPTAAWIYFIGLVQLIGGILLVLGLFTRHVALIEMLMLLGTAVLWTRRGGWFWHKGGMEYSVFWAITAFVVFCHGGGTFSLDSRFGL